MTHLFLRNIIIKASLNSLSIVFLEQLDLLDSFEESILFLIKCYQFEALGFHPLLVIVENPKLS